MHSMGSSPAFSMPLGIGCQMESRKGLLSSSRILSSMLSVLMQLQNRHCCEACPGIKNLGRSGMSGKADQSACKPPRHAKAG